MSDDQVARKPWKPPSEAMHQFVRAVTRFAAELEVQGVRLKGVEVERLPQWTPGEPNPDNSLEILSVVGVITARESETALTPQAP